MRHLLVLMTFVSLAACSFDNGKYAPVEKTVSTPKDMTQSQKDLVAAARLGNVALVEKGISTLKVHEFSFKGFAETPMGVAIAADNLEVVKMLWGQSVDAFNLGAEQEKFESQVLKARLQDQLRSLKHVKRAESVGSALNKSASLLATEYAKKTQSILELVTKSDFAAAQGLMTRTGISCQFVRNQIIQDLQADVLKGPAVMVKFLKQMKCSAEISSSDVQLLYETELIRQFQRMFNDPLLLGYLSHSPNLKTTMWNIDDSGLWMSPTLLMRISWSPDNLDRAEGVCPPPSVEGQKNCDFFDDLEFGPADYQAEKAGIQKSRFELVYTNKGAVIGSYRRFARQVRRVEGSRDPVFEYASMYLNRVPYYGVLGTPYKDENGVTQFKEEKLPWTVGLQQLLENRFYESDSFDESQWEEIQEARRKAKEQEEAERAQQAEGSDEPDEKSPEAGPFDSLPDLPNPDEPGVLPPLPVPSDLPDVE
ncbi:hypothetical protein ACNH6C_15950 [Bdellovibrio bacteriovorus]|uniref:hypothetical protein n=1 Tax=Bdellovibrio bacteriovorus TaxID=959 RepID=UPI003A80C040